MVSYMTSVHDHSGMYAWMEDVGLDQVLSESFFFLRGRVEEYGSGYFLAGSS